MKMPQYITVEEVKRVCKELKIRDWTRLKRSKVLYSEAKAILSRVNASKMKVDLEDFRAGLEVELEHGLRFEDANVTNNHPILTGFIVMAHFKESLDYYKLLDVAELEGDLVKAVAAGDAAKIKKYYRRLAEARIILSQAELRRIK
jgi:predicted nucleic acid-binding protein